MTPCAPYSPTGQRTLRILAFLLVAVAQRAGAQATWLVRADWLQAPAISIDRSTMPSAALSLERRTDGIAIELGYLRAVRSLSTAQGGFALFSRPIKWGSATAFAGGGMFFGGSSASADTTGYTYITDGKTGYQPRFSYSTAASFGAGVQLSIVYPLGTTTEIRASASEWGFSGHPVSGDNARFLAGIGIAFHLPNALTGANSAKGTH